MTTCQEPLRAEIEGDEPISEYWLAYFRDNFRADLHDKLLELFEAYENSGKSQADLARKLGRRPEQISRWLRTSGNLEADTVSDLSLAMGCLPKVMFEGLTSQPVSNYIEGPVAFEQGKGARVSRSLDRNSARFERSASLEIVNG